MRIMIATLALSLAAPAFAAPATHDSFERDGVRYDYTRTDGAKGVVLISGEATEDHRAFNLRVDAGHVTGTFGDTPVDFIVSKATMAALATSAQATIASN